HRSIRLLDWVYLVAEHDDHHLALARQAISSSGRSRTLVSDHEVADDRRMMTILQETTSSVRDLFDIPEDVTYLNCANMSPQLKAVTAAGLEAVRIKADPSRLAAREWFSNAEALRALAVQVVGCDPEGIALVPAARYGIAVAAANVPLSAGQCVVVMEHEFPSNVYAWRSLARKQSGAVVTVAREPGESWADALIRNIGDRTAIVA